MFKKKCFVIWSLSLLILLISLMAVDAAEPPSLTNFMQIYGKVMNPGSAGELVVQVGEDEENYFSTWVKADGTYGYEGTFKIFGNDDDDLYVWFEGDEVETNETYQNKAVKEVDFKLVPDCSKPSTLIYTYGSCVDKKKIGTASCDGKTLTKSDDCCDPNWVNCTDWSSCSSGQRTQTCIDANKCDPKALTKTDTEHCGGSSSGSGSKGSCSPKWQCESWSLCSADLKKSRECIDLNDCANDKTEEIACDKCEESWICNLWSNCVSNVQIRSCSDEHKCGTTLTKPMTTQPCTSGVSKQVVEEKKPVVTKTASCSDGIKNQNEVGVDCGGVCKTCPTPKKTKTDLTIYYLIAGIILVLGAIGGLLYFFVFKPKSSVLDESTMEELKNVYDAQEERGLTEDEITDKMVERGWDESVLKNFLRKR